MSQQSTKLTDAFVTELFAVCIRNSEVFQIVREHVKYSYLTTESDKKVLKTMVALFEIDKKVPTIGIIRQTHADDFEVLQTLQKISKVIPPSAKLVIDQLETFIRESLFVQLYDTIGQNWIEGNKEKVFKELKKQQMIIEMFTLKNAYYERIFGDFEKRTLKRKDKRDFDNTDKGKMPFGIDEIDAATFGGMSVGDIALYIAQSGVGKTKALRWSGVHAARCGHLVVHIQAEGSKDECLGGYDATWSGVSMYDQMQQDLTEDQKKRFRQVIKNIKISGGEIFVEAFEAFGSGTILAIRTILQEITNLHGPIGLVIVDYLEKIKPADDGSWKPGDERSRRKAIADQLKNLALEFQTRVLTATQASTVNPVDMNDVNFVMTRFNISEIKALVDPFSFVFTLNQTRDEKAENRMRLYPDKLRNYPNPQIPYHIYQNYDQDKFYDRRRTRDEILSH